MSLPFVVWIMLLAGDYFPGQNERVGHPVRVRCTTVKHLIGYTPRVEGLSLPIIYSAKISFVLRRLGR